MCGCDISLHNRGHPATVYFGMSSLVPTVDRLTLDGGTDVEVQGELGDLELPEEELLRLDDGTVLPAELAELRALLHVLHGNAGESAGPSFGADDSDEDERALQLKALAAAKADALRDCLCGFDEGLLLRTCPRAQSRRPPWSCVHASDGFCAAHPRLVCRVTRAQCTISSSTTRHCSDASTRCADESAPPPPASTDTTRPSASTTLMTTERRTARST